MPSRSIADKHDVIVRIDDSRDDGLPHQIHHTNIPCRSRKRVTHRRNSAVANQQLGNNAAVGIHRLDSAVDQRDVAEFFRSGLTIRFGKPAGDCEGRGTTDDFPSR